MENVWSPDRGGSGRAGESTRFEGPEGPARDGRTLQPPDQLEDEDFVEAVSRAVLRELEGGSVNLFPVTAPGVRPPMGRNQIQA